LDLNLEVIFNIELLNVDLNIKISSNDGRIRERPIDVAK
jgi:hypothetical protein